MIELPTIEKNSAWLFADSITNDEYKFLGVDIAFKTPNNKIMPIMWLLGNYKNKTGEIRKTELKLALWNIENYEALKTELKTADGDKLFFKISIAQNNKDKVILSPIYAVA